MKGLFTNGRVAVGLSAVALICAVGGGAYAASRTGGKITVCIHHADGGLYQAKKCAKHDKSLTWNQTGIQGPQGASGPQGATGAQGAAGPQGPGATLISNRAAPDATVTGTIDGTWSYSLGCSAATLFDHVDFRLTGPGVVALIGVAHSGVDSSNGETSLGIGFERIFQGGPLVYTLVLQNGSTAVQAQLWVTGGASSCSLFGSAVPLSTS